MGVPCGRFARLFAIYVTPVTDTHDKNAHNFVLYAGNNAVVANAVFPEHTRFAAFQCSPKVARIIVFAGIQGCVWRFAGQVCPVRVRHYRKIQFSMP